MRYVEYPLAFILLFFAVIGFLLESKVLIFALFGSVVLLDTYLGLKDRRVLVFNLSQCAVLVPGYLWSHSFDSKQDTIWIWAIVVGLWSVAAILFHVWYGLSHLMKYNSTT